MNYSGIKRVDVANGIGIGVSLFVSGCRNHCEGCFNPETWSFDYGEKFTEETLIKILDDCDKPYIKTLTLLGGDPMEIENRHQVLKICKAFRERFGESKQLWMYSGYYFEDLVKDATSKEILDYLNVLIDSPFVLEKKKVGLKLRGSTNQRIIDVRETLNSNNKIVMFEV